MKFAVIDTESTGLFEYNKPADADGQPRLANLAIITLDEKLQAEGTWDLLVKPDGWTMTREATVVHGLTDEYLLEHGMPVADVLDTYLAVLRQGRVIVGHSVSYDLKIMRGELRRAGLLDHYEQTQSFCTMQALTRVCKIPGRNGYKWPRLEEACDYFKIEQPAAHSAMGDARSTVELLRKLAEMKMIPDFELRKAVYS